MVFNKAVLIFFCTLRIHCHIWAILATGSSGYRNYRHQADLCHTHAILRNRGVSQRRILSLSRDDAAFSANNPFPGQLFNAPSKRKGHDVHSNCQLTISGSGANLEAFYALITNSFRHQKVYLDSTIEDNLFMSIVDHGSCGQLLFPDGSLSADDLTQLIWYMSKRSQFKRLLIFIEACQSGSMFDSRELPPRVLAVTASNSSGASWGIYCPYSDDVIEGRHIGSCLGDAFSVSWMANLGTGTDKLGVFLQEVSSATSKSEVNIYGDYSLLDLATSDFFGFEESPIVIV